MKTTFTEDLENNRLIAKRSFAASVDKIWKAYSDPAILCQWWAPAPYTCKTESMAFKAGGHWQYVMVGPEGDEHRGRIDYIRITPNEVIEGEDYFCDEQGNPNPNFAPMHMLMTFLSEGATTTIESVTTFADAESMKQMTEMGMTEGWDLAMNQLEALL